MSSNSKLFKTINAKEISIFDTVLSYLEQDESDNLGYAVV